MGKSGTTKYPEMFNLSSPFNMESKRLNKLKIKGDEVAKKHSKEFDKMDMGQEYNEKKEARLSKKSDRIQKRINRLEKKESPASLMGPTKPKGKMKKEVKLKATMTKTMHKLPTKQAAKISGPYKNK